MVVGAAVWVAVGVDEAVTVGVAVCVAVAVTDAVGVGVAVVLAVAVKVAVGDWVGVALGASVAVAVDVVLGVIVGVRVGAGVGDDRRAIAVASIVGEIMTVGVCGASILIRQPVSTNSSTGRIREKKNRLTIV